MVKVKSEVAKKCKTLRLVRGERLPSSYTYKVIRKIYENAKAKYIGYRSGRRRSAPPPTAVRTIQAKINQTNAQIDREMKNQGDKLRNSKKVALLMQRYQILEKELYSQWRIEEH